MVTIHSPTKRGLKVKESGWTMHAIERTEVTIHSPTKRGLKASCHLHRSGCSVVYVTIHSPTKRGLKDTADMINFAANLTTESVSYNPFPDEKGTESTPENRRDSIDFHHVTRYNPFPDEKGTERPSVRGRPV